MSARKLTQKKAIVLDAGLTQPIDQRLMEVPTGLEAQELANKAMGGHTDTEKLNRLLYPTLRLNPPTLPLGSKRRFTIQAVGNTLQIGPPNLTNDELNDALSRLRKLQDTVARREDDPAHSKDFYSDGYKDRDGKDVDSDRLQILAIIKAMGLVKERIYSNADIQYRPNANSPDGGHIELQRAGILFRGGTLSRENGTSKTAVEVAEEGPEGQQTWREPKGEERDVIIRHLYDALGRLERECRTPIENMLHHMNAPPRELADPMHPEVTNLDRKFETDEQRFRQERSYSDGRTEVLEFRMRGDEGKPAFYSTRYGTTQPADLGEMEEIVTGIDTMLRAEMNPDVSHSLYSAIQAARPLVEAERKKPERLNIRDRTYRFFHKPAPRAQDLVLGIKLETPDDHMTHMYSHLPWVPWGDAPPWSRKVILDRVIGKMDQLAEQDKHNTDPNKDPGAYKNSEEYRLLRQMGQEALWHIPPREFFRSYDTATRRRIVDLTHTDLEKKRFIERFKPPEFKLEEVNEIMPDIER